MDPLKIKTTFAALPLNVQKILKQIGSLRATTKVNLTVCNEVAALGTSYRTKKTASSTPIAVKDTSYVGSDGESNSCNSLMVSRGIVATRDMASATRWPDIYDVAVGIPAAEFEQAAKAGQWNNGDFVLTADKLAILLDCVEGIG